ncbi:PadR family transcriptional regulator [Haloprofundus sp. MHR1]|nr:PadR family transcriptional regulator [Haloprofundus sp. MHR1]
MVAIGFLSLSESEFIGLRIKARLQEQRDEVIHHGRLYTNLDELVDMGLVEKGTVDQRSNSYQLTRDGRRLIEGRKVWLDEAGQLRLIVDGGDLA